MEVRLVYVTCESHAEAMGIGRKMVERRLAACANILGEATSIYRWEGKLEQGSEVVLILKTQQAQADGLVEAIKTEHSYEVPCVVVLPVLGGNPEYLEWVQGETQIDE